MSRAKLPRGFSLVELMVGLVITMLACVAMFQIFEVSERNKRTTTGASDAQTNGALGLFVMEREIRMAGFNMMSGALYDCNPDTTYAYYSEDGGTTTVDLSGITQPVRIVDGGTGSDSIIIAMSANDTPANALVSRTELQQTMPQSSSEFKVSSVFGCEENGLVLMVQPCTAGTTPAGSCTLMEITGTNASSLHIQHNPASNDPSWNPKIPYQNANHWPAFQVTSSCKAYGICMPAPENLGFAQFSIINYELVSRRVGGDGVVVPGTATDTLAPQIMAMQAVYGVTDIGATSGTLTWKSATTTNGDGKDWTGVLSKEQVQSVKAVRIAIVARSGEYEKPTGSTCDATASAPTYSWGTFSTTGWPSDWQCYRYKVYETVVPLINVIWADV